jgi:hypothetical protein
LLHLGPHRQDDNTAKTIEIEDIEVRVAALEAAAAQDQFETDLAEWRKTCAAPASGHQLAVDVHAINRNKLLEKHAEELAK